MRSTHDRSTLGADAAYDARHDGYGVSQTVRKRIEQIFGWFKTVAGLRKTRVRGRAPALWPGTKFDVEV